MREHHPYTRSRRSPRWVQWIACTSARRIGGLTGQLPVAIERGEQQLGVRLPSADASRVADPAALAGPYGTGESA